MDVVYQRIYENARRFAPPSSAPAPDLGTPSGKDAPTCPICGVSDRKFMPFGLHERPNSQCPVCGSLERHRMLWLYLCGNAEFFDPDNRVLHMAPEECLQHCFGGHFGDKYVTMDRYDARSRVRANFTDLPFAEGLFDVAISCHVLEHVQDDMAAISELGRIIRPDGRAIVMVPYDPDNPTYEDPKFDTPAKRLAAYGHPFHYRIYGHDLIDRIEQAGFEVAVHGSKELFSPDDRRRFRINTNWLLDCVRT